MGSAVTLRLILFGRQGAGKGTQCVKIVARTGAVHISTGDMLRQAVADGTPLGRQAKELIDAGELVSDDVMVGIVRDRLAAADVVENGWILDGFPRTLMQAEALWDLLGSDGIGLALDVEVPLPIVRERMLGRGRDDDTDEAITRRLELYEVQTVPAIDLFDRKGKLVRIDGVGTEDEVAERVATAIAAFC